MARRLDVYLQVNLVGVLQQDDSGQLRFQYTPSWLADPLRVPISQRLPLRPEPFGNREARPFFAGLLPEAEKRDAIARELGISARNDFGLLDRIGGECAGAIMFMHAGETPASKPSPGDYRHLDDDQLARVLEILPERPLLAGEAGVRLSLAGAQDKLPVLVVDGKVAIPLNGAPSSHILKPPIRRFDDTVFNEGFCLALAKALGLYVIDAEIHATKGRDYLLVERYDRKRGPAGDLQRLHQEDFCQALGVVPELKYQSEGGPTLKQCFDLLRGCATRPAIELMRLLDEVIFNVLVGNNDAHAKNLALLYGERGVELAPMYDISSTVVYEGLSPKFAMRIGDQDEFSSLYSRHWDRFAIDAGLGRPQVRRQIVGVARSIGGVAEKVRSNFMAHGNDRPVLGRIVALIKERSDETVRRFSA